MLTAGVASLDEKSGAALAAALQQTGLVRDVQQWDLGSEAHLAAGGSMPDVMLLEIGRDATASLEFSAEIHRRHQAACIIACSNQQQPSPDLLIQAMRSGVREFLIQPIDPNALRENLARLMKQREVLESDVEKLILVMGVKGGVGSTTVAVNLGVQISALTKQRTALFDFGRPVGFVSLFLDLQPQFTIRDAVENLERLDSHFLQGLLTPHSSGLQVLAGAAHPDVWQEIPAPAVARVINVAQSEFDFVVADLGSAYSSEWAPVLRLARLIVLVAETEVPSLWALERHFATLQSLGVDVNRLRIVINRWHRSDDEPLQAFEKKVKHPIFARLPNDFRQVTEAVNRGVALSRNHNDPLVSKFRHMASEMAGVAQPKTEKKGSLLSLFSKG